MIRIDLRQTIPLRNKPSYSEVSWLWTDCGTGKLLAVDHVRADWWAVCRSSEVHTLSFACTPDTSVYRFADDGERKAEEAKMQARLQTRREAWERQAKADKERIRAMQYAG